MATEVILREVVLDDLPIFHKHQADQVAARLAAFATREWDAFLAHWTRILADNTINVQTIVYNGQVAGYIVCFEASGKREIGYWLGRAYWGKGVATQALVEFLVQVTHRPLYAYVAKHNQSSIRVLEKCGFTLSGEDKNFSSGDGKVVEGFILQLK